VLARILLVLAVAVALVPARADSNVQKTPADRFDLARPEIKTFIEDVARRNSLNKRDLRKLLAKAQPQPKIIEMITKPAERVSPWWEYRERFMTEERIALGAQLWLDHRLELEDIAKAHGVPPEYIIAIIGVETKYGRITGRYRVLDALATLAFDYPPRSEFFRKELEQFVLLSREERLDPLKTLGSYAGAMGNAQFMPSSYRKYAVDAQDDKKRDLWADWGDVFASIANYFRQHGWQTGAPVMAEVELDPDQTFVMDTRNLSLNETIASLATQGVETRIALPATTPAMLVFAEQSDGPAYRVGFDNFQVIMRYNRSPRYAMAVHDLAEAVAERVARALATPLPAAPIAPTSGESTALPPAPAESQASPPAEPARTPSSSAQEESGDSSAAGTADETVPPEPAPRAPSQGGSSAVQTPTATSPEAAAPPRQPDVEAKP
jgi:membrane-bound lytic murein transglycosylase B